MIHVNCDYFGFVIMEPLQVNVIFCYLLHGIAVAFLVMFSTICKHLDLLVLVCLLEIQTVDWIM